MYRADAEARAQADVRGPFGGQGVTGKVFESFI